MKTIAQKKKKNFLCTLECFKLYGNKNPTLSGLINLGEKNPVLDIAVS